MSLLTHTLHQLGEKLSLKVYGAIIKRDFIVINYHMVSEQQLAHVAHLFPYKTPDMFERDLDYLQRHFQLVSYEQLVNHITGTCQLSPGSAVLTFDDGFAECYQVVRPILLKRGVPCTFFVNTSYIDNRDMAAAQKASLCIDKITSIGENAFGTVNQALQESLGFGISNKSELISLIKSTGIHNRTLIEELIHLLGVNCDEYLMDRAPYLTTTQIQSMHAEGFTIGSHGIEHTKFSDLTEAQIEEAISNSCLKISQLTGKQSVPFAFPHNADSVSRELLRSILSRYPQVGLLFDTHGIQQEESFLISRLNGDRLLVSEKKRSNLDILIKRAYIEEINHYFR